MHNTRLKMDGGGEENKLHVIPFRLGSDLVLKSISNPELKTRTTLYGAVPGQMIIIEEPLFSLTERFSGHSEGFSCAYMHGIHLFTFKSKFIRRLFKNVIGIEYPNKVERIQIRSSTRIDVNIETEIVLGAEAGTISALVEDISDGGCRLVLPKIIQAHRGSKFHLTFTLPDNQCIDNLACAVMNIKHLHDRNATVVGVSFSGPAQAIKKVAEFCKLCAFNLVRF